MLSETQPLFEGSTNLFFLTLKGPKKVHNKIDFTVKKCKKISKNFLVVREKNKNTEGYHFHALIKADDGPPKTWYTKGVHMHLKKVGKSDTKEGHTMPVPDITRRDVVMDECPMHYYVEAVEQRLIADIQKRQRRQTNVTKILTYMSKEMDMPMQYTDYYLSCRGKSCQLTTG